MMSKIRHHPVDERQLAPQLYAHMNDESVQLNLHVSASLFSLKSEQKQHAPLCHRSVAPLVVP